jgi:glycolate dehydrogenase FAD-binding subunit
MTGSFGTLGVVTEACFKVRPAPEHYALAIGRFERLDGAFAAISALGDFLHLEVLSPAAASVALRRPQAFAVLAGFGGNLAEINYHRDHVLKTLGHGAAILTGAEAVATYEHLRDLQFPGAVLAAQLAVLPAELAHCLGACHAEFRAHAASGVAQLFVSGRPSAQEARETLAGWRENAHAARGHLRLLSAPAALRAGLDFFGDPGEGAFKLMRRLKESFDPAGIFNPGCFVGGL